MKRTAAVGAAITLIGLLLPSFASAATFTFVCTPSTEPAPADWFGGPYTAPIRLVIDTTAHTVELTDDSNRILGATANPARLASLNDYQMDVTVTESTITWGVIEMWGFSGYVDRRSGRIDAIWNNPGGYSPATLTRQFHGTCQVR